MEYQQTGGKNRKSVVIVTVVMVIIVVALLIAVIVTAVNKTKNRNLANTTSNTTISLNDTNEPEEKDPTLENTTPVENDENSTVSNEILPSEEPETTPATITTETTDLPATGPEDLLPVILILGLSATLAATKFYAKRV